MDTLVRSEPQPRLAPVILLVANRRDATPFPSKRPCFGAIGRVRGGSFVEILLIRGGQRGGTSRCGGAPWRVLCVLLVCPGAFVPVAGASASSWKALVPSALNGDSLVTPVDLGLNAAGPAIQTPGAVAQLGVAISPDGRTAYSVSAGSHALVAVDLSPSPPTAGTPVDLTGSPPPASGRNTQNIAISPDGRKAYVADSNNDQVIPIDLTTTPVTLGAPIAVGAGPQGIAFSPDGSMAYVADNGAGSLTPIMVATDTALPAITGVGVHPRELAITPDGSTAYVADNGSSNVYPVALPSGVVGMPISVGSGLTPLGIAITPDGTRAYTANFGVASGGSGSGDTVTPITLSTATAGTPITVGGGPWSIAVTPDSKTVYVGNSNDFTVTPIDVASGAVGSAITGVNSPRSIAITPDQAPVANFMVTSAPPGSATSFDASASTVQFGTIAKYVWSFGDGTPDMTTATPTTSHVYASANTYAATVTETDSEGTSTSGEVYTGQTASRVGNPSAATTRTVVISATPQPIVSLSGSSLDFGAVAVGAHSTPQTVRVINTGNASLSISSSTVAGSQAGDYTLSNDGCSGQTLAANVSCTVTVTFTPAAAGIRSAQLAFNDNASGSPHTIPLNGQGTTLGTVTGHVTDPSTTPTKPLAEERSCRSAPAARNGIELGGANCHTTSTDSSGAYTLSNLKPGPAAMEVHPANATLQSGSALLTVVVGPPTVQDFALQISRPLPDSVTITSPRGSQAGGNPVLYWDDPFQITLPPLAAAPAHATPNSIIVTIVDVSLASGTTPVLGSSLTYLTLYDGSGNVVGSRAIARETPRAMGGFDFTFGGLAIASGDRGTGSNSSLGAATGIAPAQTSGLHRQAHGTLSLTISSVRVAATATPTTVNLRAARGPSATAADATGPNSDACGEANRRLNRLLFTYNQETDSLGIRSGALANPEVDDLIAAAEAACGPEPPPAPPPPPCPGSYPCDPGNANNITSISQCRSTRAGS